VRRFRSCRRTVSISSIFFRQSLIVIGPPVSVPSSRTGQKKGRVLSEVAARNLETLCGF
jgi:hypothetical protein